MKRKLSRRVCRKVAYPSATKARRALNELRHTGVKRFYKCPYCRGQFHLTSESSDGR